jgi:spoIIIJ-associated protein
MVRSVEATGRNIEEATRKALGRLGTTRGEAEVEILERGRTGFLWLRRASLARVRVTKRISDRDRIEEIVQSILRLMGFNAQLHISTDKNAFVVDIETAGADGLLIGKAGHTLSSLEYLVNRMLQRDGRRSSRVILDVSGYKRRREDFIKAKALSLAKQVKSAGQKVTMEPLDAADRRIVHSVLRADPEVMTQSVGHGRIKSIVVAPAAKGRKKGRRRQSGRRR